MVSDAGEDHPEDSERFRRGHDDFLGGMIGGPRANAPLAVVDKEVGVERGRGVAQEDSQEVVGERDGVGVAGGKLGELLDGGDF